MEAVFLGPDEGEAMSDGPEKTVRLLADTEQVAATWSRYAVGTRGPDLHVHRRHADAFYVLDGSLTFGVGPDTAESVEVAAGSFVLVPAGVVHTFVNDGPGEARFLNFHAPGMGFGEYLRAMRDGRDEDVAGFDSFDPPPDGGRAASDVVVRGPDDGETIAIGPARATFKAEGSDGDGTFSLSDSRLPPPYQGPPLHWHETLVDSYYVLEGTLTVELDDDARDASPGSFVLVPPGVPHAFSNAASDPVRALHLMAPGGFEEYLKEAAAEARDEPPDPLRLASIASKYDFEAVVQPY
jgi:mannose-6-phosphate isomerase-like protein (cupin superfamily)